jgi:signal transduction histidine kinase
MKANGIDCCLNILSCTRKTNVQLSLFSKVVMGESVNGQEVLRLYPNGNAGRIPFRSRIGTKLIGSFLIIASITAAVGYFSLNYSQVVSDKFNELVSQTLPTIDSLKDVKAAALHIETATNEYVFVPENGSKYLQEINDQKSKFNTSLNKYKDLVDKYFPDEKETAESIRNLGTLFINNADKLVRLKQAIATSDTLAPTITQQLLNIKNEFEPDEIFKVIDNAISNEVNETANRTNIVNTAIRNSSLVTIFSIIVSVIVAICFGLYFSRYISNPISNLKDAATQIGIGDYVAACKFISKTQRGDEIGKLSSGIEKMRQSIESMRKNLDKLVEQRTKEVETKNAQLLEREKDLEKVNQELVTTELAKEEFISMVSHELKTPLTPLKMYVEMFLKTNRLGELNEKQLKAMNRIHRSVTKLELLINDIFDVYKLDIGRLRLTVKSVEVARLVEENVAELEPLTEDKQIEFKAEIIPPSDSVNVLCDQKRIDQVIANLVKNSVDFVPETGGRITIRAEMDEPAQNVIFTVADNGIGIPVEKMDNLFKTFYQVDTSLSRKHGGTGLGLVICKGIIESHGGKIWIDRNYTRGTSIKFTLPIARNDNL